MSLTTETGSSPSAPPRRGARGEARRRRGVRLAVLLGALLLACLASLAIGARTLPPTAVWEALWYGGGGEASVIVHELRVPRTVLGVLAGFALGLAGTVMQGHTRNPLADPGLLGVTQGAEIGRAHV